MNPSPDRTPASPRDPKSADALHRSHHRHARRAGAPHAPPAGEARPVGDVENLESRTLLAATPLGVSSTVSNGYRYLYVTGTSGNDQISLAHSGIRWTLTNKNAKGETWTWDRATTAFKGVIIKGGAGHDSINLTNFDLPSTLFGDAGNDTLIGGSHRDRLIGGDNRDRLDGRGNNDRLDGGKSADTLVGGAGVDVADYQARRNAVKVSLDGVANDGEAGENDTIATDVEAVYGGSGHDSITGSAAGDTLYGYAGNDTIVSVGGNDYVNGGAGNDSVCSGDGNDRVFGEDGHDRLDAAGGQDTVDAGTGNDSVRGGTGNDKVYGGDGNDTLDGANDDDSLYAGAGDDSVRGSAGDDSIVTIGGGARDSVAGGSGADGFWVDADGSEIVTDLSGAEAAVGALHRVASFMALRGTSVSKELLGQRLTDPVATSSSYKWKNFSANPLFAAGGPSADDVEQGAVGDCYFLATLSSVASLQAERIRQNITELGDGTYAVHFRQGGQDVFVRIDGDLPVYSFGPLAYANFGAQSSTWVPLMEKAFAFFREGRGTYSSISGGWMSEVYSAMGLAPTSKWFSADGTSLLEYIDGQLAAGKSVTFGVENAPSGSNLVSAHAYHVISVQRDENGVVASMTMRNPWGIDNGTSLDGTNDGYVTVSAAHAQEAFWAVMSASV